MDIFTRHPGPWQTHGADLRDKDGYLVAVCFDTVAAHKLTDIVNTYHASTPDHLNHPTQPAIQVPQ